MSDRVREACEACFDAHSNDCSGFVRAVAARLGVPLVGDADAIVATLHTGPAWQLLHNGAAAAASAKAGDLVIAGMRGHDQHKPDAHGHVVVVVDGPLGDGHYPTAYWGSLHGTPYKHKTLNYAWTPEDRDRITYAAHKLPPATST